MNKRKLLFFSNRISDPLAGKRILDLYPNAASAYSLRKLRTGETYAIEVRRSSDDATTDVELYSNGNSIDLSSTISAGGTLGTWIGSSSAYVETWYDQSGNVVNMSRDNFLEQPFLIDNGVIETDTNGNVCVNFNGVSRSQIVGLTSDKAFSGNDGSIFTVVETLNESYGLFGSNTSANYLFIGMTSTSPPDNCDSNVLYFNNGASIPAADRTEIKNTFSDGAPHLISLTAVDITTNWQVSFKIGYSSLGLSLEHKLNELIIYPDDTGINKSNIETDINTYYSIY